jgi:hypothetical protein
MVKKMYLMNKNIVHLIDDIFWKTGFKTETEAGKVIIRIITIILLVLDYTYYKHYSINAKFKFAWIMELQITCGRTSALRSPNLLRLWVISFVQSCALVASGWPKNFQTTYAAGPASTTYAAGPASTGQGILLVPDDK